MERNSSQLAKIVFSNCQSWSSSMRTTVSELDGDVCFAGWTNGEKTCGGRKTGFQNMCCAQVIEQSTQRIQGS